MCNSVNTRVPIHLFTTATSVSTSNQCPGPEGVSAAATSVTGSTAGFPVLSDFTDDYHG